MAVRAEMATTIHLAVEMGAVAVGRKTLEQVAQAVQEESLGAVAEPEVVVQPRVAHRAKAHEAKSGYGHIR